MSRGHTIDPERAEELSAKSKTDLTALCREAGVSHYGSKSQLIEYLLDPSKSEKDRKRKRKAPRTVQIPCRAGQTTDSPAGDTSPTEPKKVFIVMPRFGINMTAHSSREKALAFADANDGRVMTDSSARKGQDFCEVNAKVGDAIWVPGFCSDIGSGRAYIGGAFKTKAEAQAMHNPQKWKISKVEKNGSGMLFMNCGNNEPLIVQ